MPGETIRAEGHDRVGPHLHHCSMDACYRLSAWDLGQGAIWIAEEARLLYAQERERGLQLSLTDARQDLRARRPPKAEPGLAAGHVDAYDSVASAHGVGHEASGDERLVVGVGPDPKDRCHARRPSSPIRATRKRRYLTCPRVRFR